LIDPNGIENPITWIWRFAFGLTQEPAARLPYLALARDLAGLLYTIALRARFSFSKVARRPAFD
jgi:hypothetical protein